MPSERECSVATKAEASDWKVNSSFVCAAVSGACLLCFVVADAIHGYPGNG